MQSKIFLHFSKELQMPLTHEHIFTFFTRFFVSFEAGTFKQYIWPQMFTIDLTFPQLFLLFDKVILWVLEALSSFPPFTNGSDFYYGEENIQRRQFQCFQQKWLMIKVFSNFKWVPFLFMGHDGCLWGQKHCFNDIFIWKLFPTQYRHNITFTQNYDIYVGAFAWKSLLMVQQNIAIAHLLVSYGCAPFTRLLQFYMPNDFDFPCLYKWNLANWKHLCL